MAAESRTACGGDGIGEGGGRWAKRAEAKRVCGGGGGLDARGGVRGKGNVDGRECDGKGSSCPSSTDKVWMDGVRELRLRAGAWGAGMKVVDKQRRYWLLRARGGIGRRAGIRRAGGERAQAKLYEIGIHLGHELWIRGMCECGRARARACPCVRQVREMETW
eukprot:927707-Pleurochrysis_carterae.AAC.6